MSNAEAKTVIVNFLNLTSDYLNGGHVRPRDDLELTPVNEASPALPLAYLIEEESPPSLESLYAEIAVCKNCGLAEKRLNTVPGEGSVRPMVMVIGEGPGQDEDRTGRPFVGRAGQLLDKMLDSIGLSRNTNCYIANIVKCRPPGNRDPAPDETAACFPYLHQQILQLQPQIILCAGRAAAQIILKTSQGINALRGEITELTIDETTIPVLCTFHPSALLRNESLKRPAWEDLKLLKSWLDSRRGQGIQTPPLE